jgi:AraC family transcriptional regulator
MSIALKRSAPGDPTLKRGADRFRAAADADWGSLGVPAAGSGRASLMHVVRTPRAILRHAFYGPGAQIGLHRHLHPELVYGVGGPCFESEAVTTVSKRRLTYHPAGYSHALRYFGPTHVLAIELVGHAPAALPGTSVALPATAYGAIWRMLSQIVLEEPIERIDEAVDELAEGSRAAAAARPSWLPHVVDCIHAQWDKPPSAAALAAQAGVSTAYLCRSFKRLMGVTLREYGLLLRIDKARGLLWGTHMPIPEVAAETGFADQSHLTRTLASLSRQTPLRLRLTAPCAEADDSELAPFA